MSSTQSPLSTSHPPTLTHTSSPPLRQIRAHRPSSSTITVYQAYSSPIALSAVSTQMLSASPLFSFNRMTWIKPSWCWVCYRSGYGLKDANQAHILAIEMTTVGFDELLRHAVLSEDAGHGKEKKEARPEADLAGRREPEVRVQWDPERDPGLKKLGWRSLQIGIPRVLVEQWVREWIVGISDVTEMARGMKEEVERREEAEVRDLIEMGLHPEEEVYEIEAQTAQRLGMRC